MQKQSRRSGFALRAAVVGVALALLGIVFSTQVATAQKRSWDDLPVLTMTGACRYSGMW